MEVNYFLSAFVGVPLVILFVIMLLPKEREKWISGILFYGIALNFALIVGFIVYWIVRGAPDFNVEELKIYTTPHYAFIIDFLFDKVTAVYLFVGSMVTLLITRYSTYYMHLEKGYKRFFSTVGLFYLGYNFTVLSGNFETLFVGWEILGISSFLLIAFYRERYLPVRNAVKVFSIYRIGDVGILLATWSSHHLWHESITFQKLENYNLVHDQLSGNSLIGFLIAGSILIAAAAKSAQFPYSSWLPRAMEGPTPSSAVFYGSLSVHFGVFLLLRTYPFWEHQVAARVLIGLCGLTTALVAFFITRVQSTIKTQIAYASIAQIGIMLVEIAMGLETIALIHFVGNAFLRTYQLLISPSLVSYAIRDQYYHNKPPRKNRFAERFPRLASTFYVVAVKEFGLDTIMSTLAFRPLKRLGQQLFFINQRNYIAITISALVLSFLLFVIRGSLPELLTLVIPHVMMLIACLYVLRSFAERKSPMLAWMMIVFYHIWVSIAISFNDKFNLNEVLIYLSGFTVSAIIGALVLVKVKRRERLYFDLNQYYGHVYEHPRLALIFLLAAMALMGFPITASFIGEDLIISHIDQDQLILACFFAISYVMSGIALIRIYARIFLGPHCKTYHESSLHAS